MIAPKISRRFHAALTRIGCWSLFVSLLKLYARIIPVSREITLDGTDGGPRRPYLSRWHILPRNPLFNIYLHKFVHGDDDRALHDHPWRSWSLLLSGRYRERTSEWMLEEPLDKSEYGVAAHTWEMQQLFNPDDGRSYIEGSVTRNKGRFPGQHTFDYVQVFREGDFRALDIDHMHLIELFGNNDEECWTLFFTGRRLAPWGFACGGDEGWRDFRKYTADHPTQPNATRGCE